MTIEELGQATKKKYPQYKNVSDADLGKKILEKYPVYQSRIDNIQKQNKQEQPQQNLGKKIIQGEVDLLKNSLIGGAKGIASTISGMSSLGQKILQGTVGKALGQKPQPIIKLPSKYTEPSNQIQAGAKMGEQVAEFFLPAGKISKLEKGRGLLTKSAIEGVSAGGITALQEGKVDKGTLNTGLTVGGLNLAGGAINKIIQKIPETAWNTVLKRNPTQAIKNPKLGKQVAETKITGWTRESLSQQAGDAIRKIELSLDEVLSAPTPAQLRKFDTITTNKSDVINKGKALTDSYFKTKETGVISTKKVASYLDDLKTAYSHIPGEQSSVEAIDVITKDLIKKPTLTPLEANQLKRDIYQHIAKSYGKGTMEIPVKTEAQKQIARGLKTEIEKIIPEVKTLNEKQAVYIQMKKAIDATIARTEGKGVMGTGVGLYDLILGVGGVSTGLTIPTIGILAGKRILGTRIATGVSKMITAFNQMSPTKKVLFYTALKGMISQETK